MSINITPEQISKMLRKPEGEDGLYIAASMDKLSAKLIRMSYKAVSSFPGKSILEIGFGSGSFMKELMDFGNELIYGIDYSDTMITEACKKNNDLIEQGVMKLFQASSEDIPLEDESVSKAVAINTIYFWDNPQKTLKELRRVIRSDGYLCVGFRSRDTIQHLEFTNYNFNMFSVEDAKKMLEQNGFKVISVKLEVDREYDAVAIVAQKI